MWLANVTVIDAHTRNRRPGCWVQFHPTGAVRGADDPPVDLADEPVIEATGQELTVTPARTRAEAGGIAEIADALQQAIVAGDQAAMDRIYTEDVLVWHNYDGIERDKAESLEAIAAIHREYVDFGISDVRRDYLHDGYVQRSIFHAVDQQGRRSAIDAMMRVWTVGDQICRIEEYTDTATVEPPGRTTLDGGADLPASTLERS